MVITSVKSYRCEVCKPAYCVIAIVNQDIYLDMHCPETGIACAKWVLTGDETS